MPRRRRRDISCELILKTITLALLTIPPAAATRIKVDVSNARGHPPPPICITIRVKESFTLLVPIAMHRSVSHARLFIDDEEVRAHPVSKQRQQPKDLRNVFRPRNWICLAGRKHN